MFLPALLCLEERMRKPKVDDSGGPHTHTHTRSTAATWTLRSRTARRNNIRRWSYDGRDGSTSTSAKRRRAAATAGKGERGECKKCQSSFRRTGGEGGREGKNGSSFPMMIPVYNRRARARALRCCLPPAPMYPYLDKPVADRGRRQTDKEAIEAGGQIDHDPPAILTVMWYPSLSLCSFSASARSESDAIRPCPALSFVAK